MAANTPLPPGFLIYDVVRLFRRCFGVRLADLDLSEAQWRVLGTLKKLDGLSQSDIAETLGIGKAPLGKQIDRLEQAGLLRREPDQQDRRIKRLHLTNTAAPLTDTLRERYESLQAEFLAGVSDRRQRQLEAVLCNAYHNLAGREAPELALMQLLTHVSQLMRREFDSCLKPLGLTPGQWLVLTSVHNQQGLQQARLAELLHMQRAPLGSVIDELEQQGWLERRPDPGDRRAKLLYLAAEGERRWPQLLAAYHTMHADFSRDIGASRLRELRRALNLLRTNLQAIAEGDTP